MTDSITHFLTRTKLQRPHVSRGPAPRPHLLERLDTSHSLEFVLAPAGYGKTTLMSTWQETCDISNAWLSLDGYQLIHSRAIHELLMEVVRRPPRTQPGS